ncbi:EAL domain-containing protein [Ferrimonas sp. YFM]|uniref:putative bifunctional diguanylate cyclase/phosphodiesterase n=1 Tax=Ferrimonas sp. YFM TaxID=3028878 RepID=UPI0025737F61|nr:EAL domain-containing protein [Ferrimonas sp. YFM]BDY03475.1 GGDEF-domain containing protein [Ferrimonas sp. YFM]
MKRFKLLVLTCVVLLFAFSSVISSQRHSQMTNLLSLSMKTVSWSAAELEMELIRLQHAFRRVALSDLPADEARLRFEIFWSRVEVLAVGEEARDFRGHPGVEQLLQELRASLTRMDSQVMALSDGDVSALELLTQLAPMEEQVRQLNVRSFSGDRALFSLKRVFDLQYEANIYLLGLLLSGAFLVILVIRESRNNRRQALHDSLTNLPNRNLFQKRLELAISKGRRKQHKVAVYMMDMNGFKEINDQLGHAAGDQLLREVAARLKNSIGKGELVARLGGDEFGVLQQGVTGRDQALVFARQLAAEINTPVTILGQRISPRLSIGISLFPEDALQPDKLLNNADTAMYAAKNEEMCCRLFEQEMENRALRKRILAEDLKRAIAQDQLQQLYQPIVSVVDRRVILVEALLRWRHPVYGDISPLEVVALAEQSGLAESLNFWVMTKACHQNMAWRCEGLNPPQVSVNISPMMYSRYDLVAMVERVLAETGLPAEQLVIEVTEDTTMQDIESSPQILSRLRGLGVELALDDFGTGHSSLSHLKKMPFQKLKIDKSFVRELEASPRDVELIRAIIHMAHGLGMQVVAEGIEEYSSFRQLSQQGCEYAQGYLLYKPLPSGEIGQILSSDASVELLQS